MSAPVSVHSTVHATHSTASATAASAVAAKPQLHVAVIQADLHWQDAAANHRHLASLMDQAPDADLLVLPEMFNSGFSMQSQHIAQSMQGESVTWLQAQAAARQAVICGSLAIQTQDGVANRCCVVYPDGTVTSYDKKHLFRMGQEHQHYLPGTERVIVQVHGWRFLLQICYDLRFPVFSRNTGDYDGMIYVANWPAARRRIWQTLLSARAIENQAFVLGCNRVGQDANPWQYSGDSQILDFVGEAMTPSSAQEQVLQACLDWASLQAFRQKFPAYLDADRFMLLPSA